MKASIRNKYIFGYRAGNDKTNDEFLEKYSNYEEGVFIPDNMNEYVEIINALNNEI